LSPRVIFPSQSSRRQAADFARARYANGTDSLLAVLDAERAAVAMFAYVDGLIGRWLLLPGSVDLLGDVEKWVDTGLDMLRLSPALRK
jgi:hypothetical protein